MEPLDADPTNGTAPRRRGLRVAIVAAVVVAVWASMWAIGRPALTTPRSPPPSPPAVAQGKPQAPPAFSPADGWGVWTSGTLPPGSRNLPMALAANVTLAGLNRVSVAANGLSESSITTALRTLPREGMVLVALLPFPAGVGPAPPHFGDFPDRGWPLQLADARVTRVWQSQPRPSAPEYDLWGRVEGTYVEVSVYFGTPNPSAAAVREAQSELDRLILPGVPAGYAPTLDWTAEDAGPLTIQTPPGWTFIANPTPDLVDPKIWFAMGTWAFPRGGSCGPQAALRFLPRNGALVWVSDAGSHPNPAEFPRRPARFTLHGRRAVLHECSTKPSYLIPFRDRGRAFQAQIAFGPDASAGTRAEALRSLSSLRIGSETG